MLHITAAFENTQNKDHRSLPRPNDRTKGQTSLDEIPSSRHQNLRMELRKQKDNPSLLSGTDSGESNRFNSRAFRTEKKVKECDENHEKLETTLTEFKQNDAHAETECSETVSTGEEPFVASVGPFCNKAKGMLEDLRKRQAEVKELYKSTAKKFGEDPQEPNAKFFGLVREIINMAGNAAKENKLRAEKEATIEKRKKAVAELRRRRQKAREETEQRVKQEAERQAKEAEGKAQEAKRKAEERKKKHGRHKLDDIYRDVLEELVESSKELKRQMSDTTMLRERYPPQRFISVPHHAFSRALDGNRKGRRQLSFTISRTFGENAEVQHHPATKMTPTLGRSEPRERPSIDASPSLGARALGRGIFGVEQHAARLSSRTLALRQLSRRSSSSLDASSVHYTGRLVDPEHKQ